MANRFNYESPLNRLLSVTVPQFVSKERDREESSRRFDKEMGVEADARRQQQLNYQQEQTFRNKEFDFNVSRAEKSDDADFDSNLISSLDRVGNLNQRMTRAEKILPTLRTEFGKNNLQGVIDSSKDTISNRKLMLDSYLGMGLIKDNEYNVMQSNIASSGYDNMNTQIIGQAIKQSNLENNREWKTNQLELESINTMLTIEAKNVGTALYGTKEAKNELNLKIKQLNTRKDELLKLMKTNQKAGTEDKTPGSVTLAGGGTITGGQYDGFVQGTTDDLPIEVWSSLEIEDIEDLEQKRKEYTAQGKSKLKNLMADNPALTIKEKAILRKAELTEKRKTDLKEDATGRSTLKGFLEMMGNLKAGDNPQTPFNPMGY